MQASESKIVGSYIDRTMKVIRQKYLQTFKELGLDITTEQWVLLDQLYLENGRTQKELATDSFKNAPTVSRIIDLLCKKGFTERRQAKDDRRSFCIFLTRKGKQVCEKAYPSVFQLREQGWQNLSDRDYKTFLRIINQVYDNFK